MNNMNLRLAERTFGVGLGIVFATGLMRIADFSDASVLASYVAGISLLVYGFITIRKNQK